MIAMWVDAECVDGVWVATAPWTAASVTGESFEEVFWAIVKLKPKGWRDG